LGHGVVGHDAPWMFDASGTPFDPDKARWHVAAAEQTDPITLVLPDQPFPGAEISAHLLARAANDIGLEVKVRLEDHGDDWHLRMARSALCGDVSFAAQNLSVTRQFETSWATPESALQFAYHLQSARAVKDPKARKAGFTKAASIMAREGNLLLPLWANEIYAHSSALACPNIDSMGHTNLSSILKGWWFS